MKHKQGVKFDGGKTRIDLLTVSMPNAVLDVSKVLTFGANKYSDDNWKKVPDANRRYSAALDRHMNALHRGEKCDPETGLSHLAHAACCVLFMLELANEDRAVARKNKTRSQKRKILWRS